MSKCPGGLKHSQQDMTMDLSTLSVTTWCVNATCDKELAQRINRLERDNTILGLCYGDTADDRGGGGLKKHIP